MIKNLLKKSRLYKKHTINGGGILCLITTAYALYYLLLNDKLLPISISSITTFTSHCTTHWHILAAGLIPVYLALIIFGTAILSLHFGSALQRWLIQALKK